MKKFFSFAAVAMLLGFVACEKTEEFSAPIDFNPPTDDNEYVDIEVNDALSKIKIMSYNVCVSSGGENDWAARRDGAIEMIDEYKPDVIGMQECSLYQLEFFAEQLATKNYKYIAVSRDTGTEDNNGERCALIYNASQYEVLESGTFWLAEKSNNEFVTIPTKGWDAEYLRICTWAILRDKDSSVEFAVYNTHLEYKNLSSESRGATARVKGLDLIVEHSKGKMKPNRAVFIIGDMNDSYQSGIFDNLLKEEIPYISTRQYVIDAKDRYDNHYEELSEAQIEEYETLFRESYRWNSHTYHGHWETHPENEVSPNTNNIDPTQDNYHVIDHIFGRNIKQVLSFRTIRDKEWKSTKLTYISDHYPILSEVTF